jgi:hypothetical protein
MHAVDLVHIFSVLVAAHCNHAACVALHNTVHIDGTVPCIAVSLVPLRYAQLAPHSLLTAINFIIGADSVEFIVALFLVC